MDKALTAIMGGMLALIMVVAVAQMAQAMGPTLAYACPICGAKFATYDELYAHFVSEHPAEDIEILWT